MKQALTQRIALSIGFVAVTFFTAPSAFAGQDCECVGNGKRIKEGGVICLQIGSSQRYLARCERNLNNTSWKKISDGCPVSETSPSQMSPWQAG
ncbi:hypothetical protein [Hoeflea alexandrii]|mgnify:FL=1|jgi:hypothetical protein|uniref:hypothetical protein n=1 Tax=Hoeflea alexandrii TaxID=288436 RepID=UPI00125857D8|nr:conserved exported hypothetical protein [Hoeflea sp. EC-HK425]|tara:strand:+ start:392 stop:673 length:282 start_codon:yes stop_codon:yes gene_type:complete